MTLAAYYYPATKAQRAKGIAGKYELHELENGARRIVLTIDCTDKPRARDWARHHTATPWNF